MNLANLNFADLPSAILALLTGLVGYYVGHRAGIRKAIDGVIDIGRAVADRNADAEKLVEVAERVIADAATPPTPKGRP